MKKNVIKVNHKKYTLNYSPIEIRNMSDDYNDAIQFGDIRTVKSYFAEACLSSKELKSDRRSFTDLINLFTNKTNQFNRLGATFVFGASVKSIILHKGSDTVKRTNIKIERDLLAYILKVNRGRDHVDLEFLPGFIIRVRSIKKIEVLFDFRKNIRNY